MSDSYKGRIGRYGRLVHYVEVVSDGSGISLCRMVSGRIRGVRDDVEVDCPSCIERSRRIR